MTPESIIEKRIKKKGGRLNYEELHPKLKVHYSFVKERAEKTISAMVKQLKGVKKISFDIIDDYSFNAFATGVGHNYFIGINKGAIATLSLVFNRLLADKAIFPFIGDINNEKENLPLLENIYINYEATIDSLPLFYPPQDPVRNIIAEHMTRLALDFLLGHEMTHIIKGHISYLSQEFKVNVNDELSLHRIEKKRQRTISKTMEMDADSFATTMLLSSEINRCTGKLPLRGKEWEDLYSRPGFILLIFSIVISTLFRIFGDKRLNESTFELEPYPKPRLRFVIAMLQIASDPDFLKLNKETKYDLDKNGVPITISAGFKLVEDAFQHITGKESSGLSIKDAWGELGFSQINKLINFWNSGFFKDLEKHSYIQLFKKENLK